MSLKKTGNEAGGSFQLSCVEALQLRFSPASAQEIQKP